jgi:lipid II:glycine glycyltransferase (peptidoglycan interpeptide bridge formation enzyme)
MVSVRPIEHKEVWEDFMAAHPEANFLQSWYWGDFHERLGHTIVRRGFYENDILTGIMLAIVEPARRGRHMVVPGGPIIDWQNPAVVKAWTKELKTIAKVHKCVFVRVRPQLPDSTDSRKRFKLLGFRRAPMHLHAELTSQLDLTKTDEELKKAMRKGTRYELNRVVKTGIEVTETTGEDYLDEFYDLQIETAKRQHFVPFSKKFLIEQFRAFAVDGKVKMYRSTADGKLLAMGFIIFYGQEAAYHYGASTELARKLPGAYAVQWKAIGEARHRGCKRYNFWGVTEHGQTKHRFYGVSVFKRGFGGEDMAYLPAQDLVVDIKRYPATFLFETARRKLRKL